ncbi:shwachman-Bodian-diamond syndrome protein [Annulohypoxylon truncatum]|uniref:shwachman-Bodian-diamond syndrome protein n=1 Tax=Annulohypoxylon truncatum TaxID=327061 RepID=UPI002008811B|nr:shwachman-Bodian-diamond syndrome protein [Annulohypoxylon truncatum]KAI1208897.1 shwachman-Bodian-diamond syndrome protein [Annulohypoxylon truncatum]
MTKGEASQIKVHYKGKDEDFIIFIDDLETYKKWKSDKSIPMAHFISTFQVFVTHKQGTQGQMDGASKATLDNEFGVSNEDEVIKKILDSGSLQESEFPERQGPKNDAQQGSIVTGQVTR